MLKKSEKSAFRSRMFRHLDGIVTVPTAHTLWKKQIPTYILENKSVEIGELSEHFNANAGYLNVALRLFASQGWLQVDQDKSAEKITYRINDRSEIAFSYFPSYAGAAELTPYSGNSHRRKFELAPFRKQMQVFEEFKNRFNFPVASSDIEREIQEQVLAHIEGILLGPTMVHLGMSGMFHKYFMEAHFRADEFHENAEDFEKLLDMLVYFDYFKKNNASYSFTEKGLFYARRAAAYGVTVSYQPTLRNLDELIFGNPSILRDVTSGDSELHVDRPMNVWGSGGAHAAYFKVIDEVIKKLFNRPIEEQPRGILDMGCGNGAFLIHLFDVIEKQTLRGQMLEDYPLILVGSDFNREALDISRSNLIHAEIWAKMIWGDIGNPDQLAADLLSQYNIELGELLNVRTFLDHNRPWQATDLEPGTIAKTTGAYAHRGKHLSGALVEQNLKEHLTRWKPYIKKFGLLAIELHTVPSHFVASNIGRTPASAYDATHGYSDQYIVEIAVFREIAKAAGLESDPSVFRQFPDADYATVSIHLLRSDG